MVEVAQTLLGRGYKVRIYDPALNLGALVGANKRVIDTRMPHLASLLHAPIWPGRWARGASSWPPALRHARPAAAAVTPEHT